MQPKKQPIVEEVQEEKELAIIEPNDLAKPEKDTKFAQESARLLVDIIKQNNWSRKLGGQSEHIQYEGWQTAGKYYGLSVKTHDSEYIELGGTWGFRAKATVVNERTGVEVGSAEAYCMSDEYNWKNKPKFQLASMAQTRAGSKALRQILGFVIALAGYNPTPAEEMEQEQHKVIVSVKTKISRPISSIQKNKILMLLGKKGKNVVELSEFLKKKFGISSYKDLSDIQADFMIGKLEGMPDMKAEIDPSDAVGEFESADLNDEELNNIDEGIEKQRTEK